MWSSLVVTITSLLGGRERGREGGRREGGREGGGREGGRVGGSPYWSGGEGWLAQLGTLPHLTVYMKVTVSVSSDPVAVYMYLVSGSCDWC